LKLKYKSYERNKKKKKKITQKKKEPTIMGQLDHFGPSRPSDGSIRPLVFLLCQRTLYVTTTPMTVSSSSSFPLI
jgi:hypothetical protein